MQQGNNDTSAITPKYVKLNEKQKVAIAVLTNVAMKDILEDLKVVNGKIYIDRG